MYQHIRKPLVPVLHVYSLRLEGGNWFRPGSIARRSESQFRGYQSMNNNSGPLRERDRDTRFGRLVKQADLEPSSCNSALGVCWT
jgi:hypothetical protein